MSEIASSTPNSVVERPFPVKASWLSTRNILIVMTLLELGWLVAIWLTGASEAEHKLGPLLLMTLLASAVVLFLPERYVNWLKVDEPRLVRRRALILLLFSLFMAFVILVFAAQQRVWAFDEEGNLLAATAVAQEGVSAFFNNYELRPWLGTQHPPLVPIMYGLVMRLVGVSQLIGRLISGVFALATGLLTYLIGRRLFDRATAVIGAFLLFSFPLFLRLGSAAMVEVPLTFFFSLTVLLTLRLAERPSIGRLILVGLAIGVGLLSKYTMVFVVPLAFGIFAIHGSMKQALRYLGWLALIGISMLGIWLLLANQMDVLQKQFATIWEYARLVLTSEYGRQVLLETMTNRLPSGLGLYNLPLITLGVLFLLNRRRKVDAILLLWILSVWLPLAFTLPDHRYFLPSFPAIALTAALGLRQVPQATARGLLLSLLLAMSTLYLYVDWVRVSELFIK
ncbi:MAG: glycosyltransferase family 39 protein [Anaerolineales bacterium]|nr:glycosyltransferase family 39 protein [Anaerolineales bacterium]